MVYLIISMDILPDKDLEFEQAVQWLVRLEDEVEGNFRQLISNATASVNVFTVKVFTWSTQGNRIASKKRIYKRK